MEKLIQCVHHGGNPLTVAVGVVIEIIRKNNPDYDQETVGGRDAPPTIHDPIYLGNLLRIFADNIPAFMELIMSPKRTEVEKGDLKRVDRKSLHTPWGDDIEPLGFDRFKICELMAELLHCSNMGLHNEPGSHEFMTHRDAERERLREQGTLLSHIDESSSFVYPDASNDGTINGGVSSLVEHVPGSPGKMRRSEEGGFEDMASSGVIVEKLQDPAESAPDRDVKPEVAPVSKFGLDDDLVDEPLTPPKTGEQRPEISNSPPPSQPLHVEPESPTTSTLREKVEGFNLDTPKKDTSGSQSTAKHAEETGASVKSPSPSPNQPQAKPATATPLAETSSQEKGVGDNKQVSSKGAGKEKAEDTPVQTTKDDVMDGLGAYKEFVRVEENGQPVVGDYLKIMFFKHKVIPTVFVSDHSNPVACVPSNVF